MLDDLARLIESVDPRVIAALALAVALLAYLRLIRRDRKEEIRSSAEKTERQRQRAAFLGAFKEVRFPLDPDGPRRFVYDWPASWQEEPLSQPGSPMAWKDAFFLAWAIRRLRPAWINSSVRPQDVDQFLAHGGRLLYETDAARSKRIRFLFTDYSGRGAFMGMTPTQTGQPDSYVVCVEHRHFFDTGTPNCGKCGLPMAQVLEKNEPVLKALGISMQ